MERGDSVRVIECAYTVAGAFAGKLFADLGWEVIKIEPPDNGDPNRRRGPYASTPTGSKKSLLFEYLNTNKKAITLNLFTPMGQTLFRQLTKLTDALIIDSGSDGGLLPSHNELTEMNRRLTIVDITPFGKTGPYSAHRVRPPNVPHLGGESWVMPIGLARRMFPDRGPVGPGGNISEYCVGTAAAVAVLIALLARTFTGEGQHIDLSKQEALMTHSRRGVGLLVNRDLMETRSTLDDPYGGFVACRDGFIQIQCLQDRHWDRLVKVMGSPDWTKKDICKDGSTRSQNGETIQAHIDEWASDKTREEFYQACLKHGVPAAPYYSPLEILHLEQMKERGYFKTVHLPEWGNVKFPTLPFKMPDYEWELRRPAPALGANNEEVYCNLLGYSTSSLAQWTADHII